MDTTGYLYASEMTNALAREVPKEYWERTLIPELGSLARMFAHMIRVRGIYRESLHCGVVEFPGTIIPRGSNLELGLVRSREELANALGSPSVDKIKWGDYWVTPEEIYSTAVQHEGIHQGQWHVALKRMGLDLPKSWKTEWHLI